MSKQFRLALLAGISVLAGLGYQPAADTKWSQKPTCNGLKETEVKASVTNLVNAKCQVPGRPKPITWTCVQSYDKSDTHNICGGKPPRKPKKHCVEDGAPWFIHHFANGACGSVAGVCKAPNEVGTTEGGKNAKITDACTAP